MNLISRIFLSLCATLFFGAVSAQDIQGRFAEVNGIRMHYLQAGKGEPVVLMDPTDIPVLHNASLVTAQLLKKIGVNVQVQAMDWSTLTSRRAEKKPPAEGGWNLFHTYATGADVSSPIINNGIIGGCEEKAWFGWPCSAEIEKLRDTWARATDLAKQKEIAVELQRLLYEVVPYVNFGQWFFPTAYRKSLKGVIVSPVPFFWNITKEG